MSWTEFVPVEQKNIPYDGMFVGPHGITISTRALPKVRKACGLRFVAYYDKGAGVIKLERAKPGDTSTYGTAGQVTIRLGQKMPMGRYYTVKELGDAVIFDRNP